MSKKTAALITLGCRLNQADGALLSERLERMGFEIVPENSESSPNLIIVNSCSVTATAFKKSKQALRGIRAENPQSFIVLTGCAANVDKAELDDCCEYDIMLTNEQKKDIEKILPRHLAYLDIPKNDDTPPDSGAGDFFERANGVFPFKTRAILKIQEGCDNYCTYCIVPYARGHERSRNIEETISAFKSFVDAGYREIVLSGVNICNYSSQGRNLAGLLEELLAINGNFRIRLSSTEPGPTLPGIIDVMAKSNGRICEFLHLPLQNGSDTILKAMNRHCMTEEYAGYVKYAREKMPNVHIGSDLITGFPGETDELFEESVNTLKKIAFANIHVFPFSPRKGTPAASMRGRPSAEIMTQRLEILKNLKAELAVKFAHSLEDGTETVLVEARRKPCVWEGWSGNYVKTRLKSRENMAGKLVRVKFASLAEDGTLEAELIPEKLN